MSQYGMISAIFLSFFSRKLYRDVAQNWGGKAFLYLLFVLALSWIAFTWQAQVGINHFYAKNSDKIISQVPVLTVKDGKMSTPESRPYMITDPDTHETLAVIDTTGTITTLEQAKSHMLVTDKEVIVQQKPNETRTYSFSNANAVIDPPVINNYIKRFIGFAWVLMFVFFWIGSFIYRLIQALLYAIIGKIFAAIFRARLSYPQVMQIVMVAITPALVISTVLDALAISIPHELLCYFVLTMLYLLRGIVANKD